MTRPTHFRIHDPRRWKRKHKGDMRKVWTRYTICQKGAPESETYALREDQVVECSRCMVLKDAWLEREKRKPLTLRRSRILLAELQARAARSVPL